MEETLVSLLSSAPLATFALAAIGLATVFYLFWCIARPAFAFFVSSWTVQLFFWIFLLGIAGAGSFGYGSDGKEGMFRGFGIAGIALAGIALAGLTIGIFWIRKLVKWIHSEKEEYK